MILSGIFLSICVLRMSQVEGYQYHKFFNSVSDSIEDFSNQDYEHSHESFFDEPKSDYFGKSDYAFAYGVQDSESGNYHNQKETREGDTVTGEYMLIQPDGSTRRVIYTADPKHGFRATVRLSKPNEEYAQQQKSFLKLLNDKAFFRSNYNSS